jgi:pimeloyl-ACP methyl ester carboxylesterase
MFRTLIFLYAACALSGCRSQSYIELSPNLIIPTPPPSASLSDWVVAPGRTPLSVKRDGILLRGFRYAGANPQMPVVLFFNGNGMTVAASDTLYRQIASLGPNVVVYDYRGYGFSTGAPDLSSYRADALRIYDDLNAATANHRVVLYGFSMGTAIATYIASQRELTGLILAAPIASAEEEFPIYAARLGYPASSIDNSRPSLEARDIFGEATMIMKSHAPLLVLHGTADTLVPINQGHEVFASSPSLEKRMVELDGATHNQTASQPESFKAVQQFLNSLR